MKLRLQLNRKTLWAESSEHQIVGSKAIALAVFVLLTAPHALPQEAALPMENRSAQVDELFQKMNTPVTPGCALSVMNDGRIIYERGYGMADLEHNVTITPTTIFHVASMSKQFTAASILLLVQAGKLSLDDPVREYIPELPDFGVEITIRQLIHHTSGLREELGLLDLAGWRYPMDLITDEDVLTLVSRQKDLNFPPGSRFEYSNTNYMLLAQIVKRVSGQSFREFTTSQIFQPLQMKNTHFRDDHAEIVGNIAYGYEPAGDHFRVSNTDYDTVGNTGLLTTVEDLALWDQNFYSPRIAGPAMIKQMQERGRLNDGEKVEYASGLVMGTYRGLATVDHGGMDAGYRSDMIRFPDQHFTVACLCNSNAADPNQLTRKVAELYLAKEMKSAEPAPVTNEEGVQLTPEQLRSKAGTYRNRADGHVVRISVKDDKLQVGWGIAGESHELKTISETHFFLLPDQVDFTFEPLKPGGPWRLLLKEAEGSSHVLEEVAAFTPSPSELRDYAGVYSSEEIASLYEIKLEPAGLVLLRPKKEPDALQPVTRDDFAGWIGNIRFIRNTNGEVSGFLLDNRAIQNFRFEKGRFAVPSK